jgi:glucose/arabinose dehydrogenase
MAAPIAFAQGETVVMTLTLKDSGGVPIDINGDSFEAKIKALDDLTTDLGAFTDALVTDGSDGKVALTLTAAASLAIPSNVAYNAKGVVSATPSIVYFYDVYRTKADTTRRRVASGLVTVEPTITLVAT